MDAKFQFVMKVGPSVGTVFPLDQNELIVGRDPACDVSVIDAEVSRKHARLIWQGEGFTLEDLGSTNGTFVNSKRISTPHLLRVGDTVAFGENVALLYEEVYDPDATMISSSAKAEEIVMPVEQPAPIPPTPQTSPPPVYAGQVPVGPEQAAAQPPARKGIKPWLIVVIILVVLICLCAAFLLIVDQFRLWCTIFPFLFPRAC